MLRNIVQRITIPIYLCTIIAFKNANNAYINYIFCHCINYWDNAREKNKQKNTKNKKLELV